MKFIKMLGFMATVAAAVMAFAGTASATIATSPSGTVYTGTIAAEAENGHVSLHGSNGVTIECAGTVEGKIEKHGGGVTVEGSILTLAFPNCTNGVVVHVVGNGNLVAHVGATFDNTQITGNAQKVEVTAKSIFGTITCIYTTENTPLGTLTGSTVTKGKATLDISASIPRTGGSALCGSTGTWTGNYIVNTPSTLSFD